VNLVKTILDFKMVIYGISANLKVLES